MRWKIITEDKNCMNALKEFCSIFKEEWNKAVKNIPFMPKNLEPLVLEEEDGLSLVVPIKTPFLAKLLKGWRKKTKENLEGFLKEKGISFEDIVYSD